MITRNYLECMQRQDHRERFPFDPEPEQTLDRLRRKTHLTQPEIMQHPVNAGHILDGDEPQVEQNGHNYRNPATTPFVQSDNPHMLLEDFPCHLQLFSHLYDDHLYRRTTLS